jgi:tetratricopeptide (TPR) repeat protein
MIQSTPEKRRWSRTVLLLALVPVVFGFTYLLAWWDAYRLSITYLKDADASYQDGRYLDALLGYEDFDQAKGKYVNYGGYIQVQRIWENSYAYPVPSEVARTNARIDEIIYSRLTLDDAEQFVQENIGRHNPYMGLIYLRLGELYEINGQIPNAQDVYESVPDLFPNEKALIERARTDLENLQAQQSG